MQRKVIVDEALREQEKKREKLERDFSSSYAKRLKADRGEEKDRSDVPLVYMCIKFVHC